MAYIYGFVYMVSTRKSTKKNTICCFQSIGFLESIPTNVLLNETEKIPLKIKRNIKLMLENRYLIKKILFGL